MGKRRKRWPPLGADLDLQPLAWSRAAIGALILLRTTPLLWPLDIWFLRDTWPLLGWPETSAIAASFAWLPPWLIAALCSLRSLSALLLMLGVAARPAGLIAGVSGYLVMFQNPFGFIFTLHLMYQAAILLALVDAASVFALRPEPARSPRSSYLLIHAWIASIYFWAGVHKFRPDWLDGRTLSLFQQNGAIHGGVAELILASPTNRMLAGTSVAIFEVAIGPLLLWRRTRKYALVAAFGFHLMLELHAHPDLLGWGMMALLLSFSATASPPASVDHRSSAAAS